MLIPDPAMIQGKKSMIFLMILEILKDSTDIDHPMLKEELRSKINEKFGFLPARNNIYDKLNALVEAGFPIVQDAVGVYYDGAVLSDGELRFLADSVLFSDFATHRAAADIIEALSALGSHEFQKYMKKQVYRTKKTRKNPRTDVFLNLERVQQAIFDQHQISCNFLTYTAEMQTEPVYPENIVINPYDLVYKNGKYYLFGALPDSEKMLSWRLDRLCNFKDLKTRRTDIPLLKEIEACGGMSAYVDAQPDLCGGVVETFKLQCFRDSIDEVVDAFGSDFRIAPEQSENYDSETVIVIVRTTREAMKAWAFTHAGTIVVISPAEFRLEMAENLKRAKELYRVTGMPLEQRIFNTGSLDEAVQFAIAGKVKDFRYRGHGEYRLSGGQQLELIDSQAMLHLHDLESIFLYRCDMGTQIFTNNSPSLNKLLLPFSKFNPDNLKYVPELRELTISNCDDSVIPYLRKMTNLKVLRMIECAISDISFLSDLPGVRELEIRSSGCMIDCSEIAKLQTLQRLFLARMHPETDYSFLKLLTSLKILDVDCADFSKAQAEELQKILPECEIHTRVYSSKKRRLSK